MKKKHTERITYIKTTACVEATSHCVQMSRLKYVGQTTTVTVRDREVRRDGASLQDASNDPIFATTASDTCLAFNKTVVI